MAADLLALQTSPRAVARTSHASEASGRDPRQDRALQEDPVAVEGLLRLGIVGVEAGEAPGVRTERWGRVSHQPGFGGLFSSGFGGVFPSAKVVFAHVE